VKKLFILLGMLGLFSTFSYADFGPKNGLNIYSADPVQKESQEKCNFIVEVNNTQTKKQKTKSVGCNKDFTIIYYNKKEITQYTEDEIREWDIRVLTQDKKNNEGVSALLVIDLYTGNDNKKRISKEISLIPGKPLYFKYGGPDTALNTINFKITYFQ